MGEAQLRGKRDLEKQEESYKGKHAPVDRRNIFPDHAEADTEKTGDERNIFHVGEHPDLGGQISDDHQLEIQGKEARKE